MNIKIFLFHRVCPKNDPLWQPMRPDRFEKMIKLINRIYTIIPLEEYFRGTVKMTQKKRYAAITFDDGYKDFMQYALPVLVRYKLKASMYIITDSAQTGMPPWTYQMDYLFNHSKKNFFLDKEYAPNSAPELKNIMKKISNEDRKKYLTSIKEQLNDVSVPQNLMMNWQDIIEAKKWGIEIGSHTVTHPVLSSITNQDELEYEIAASFQTLKIKLGGEPFTLSYPNGSYNENVKEIARKTGYKISLAVRQKTYRSSLHDIFEIPRIELYQQSKIRSIARIMGATDFMK